MAVAIGRLLRIINITETDPLGVQLCALTYFHQMTSKIKISQFKKKIKKARPTVLPLSAKVSSDFKNQILKQYFPRFYFFYRVGIGCGVGECIF